MRCFKCNVSVKETPLFRANPKGEDGIFLCEWCMHEEGIAIDKEVKKQTDRLVVISKNKKLN